MSEVAPLPDVPERRYERPPIVEALCELYFTGSRWDITIPGLFYEEVRQEYPQKTQLEQVQAEVEVKAGPANAQTRMVPVEPRARFGKEDGSRLLQLGRDLLVINQLRPYPHYEVWRDVVHRMLEVYRNLAAPAGLARLGVRYINRINVPSAKFPVEDYFRIYPHVPAEFGDTHGPFRLQLVILPVCPGHQLTLTLGLSPQEQPDSLSVLLDLYDVVELGGDRFGEVGRLLDEAHANVAHTFENAITDVARGLFGEVSHE